MWVYYKWDFEFRDAIGEPIKAKTNYYRISELSDAESPYHKIAQAWDPFSKNWGPTVPLPERAVKITHKEIFLEAL